jgi:hypothetical protein
VLGRVVRQEGGELVLQREPGVSVRMGMRVGFLDEYEEEAVVGQVIRTGRKTFRVRVQMNERVEKGAIGYLTPADATGSLVAPDLGEYLVSFSLGVRPWLGLEGADSGMLIDGSLGVRMGKLMRMSVVLQPLSPALGNTAGALEVYAAPSFVFDIAEIGLGIGASSVDTTANRLQDLGLLVTPHVRIGAEDGLNFRVRTGAVVRNGIGRLSSFRIDGQIPLAYGTSLLLGGGGGASGYQYGEIGVEMLLTGNGGRGSWFVQTLIGGGGTNSVASGISSGPYVGLNVEGRY